MHPEFAPVAFIAAFSLFLALPWHWRAGNVATLSIIAWLFTINIIFAVDALIWGDSTAIVAAVWCDITTKLIIGSSLALPAACLCICIHLEQVSSVRAVRSSVADKRRRQWFEAVMCFGLPVVFMALHYIVQGHRFDIIQEYGCRPTTYPSLVAIFIIWIPPIILAIGALVFAGLALRHFMLRRISFAAHLDASHSALTTSRYLRLMLMSVIQMVWSLAMTTYNLWFTLRAWAAVHLGFARVAQFPTLLIPTEVANTYYAAWWVLPASTFIFVAFFGFGREAVEDYKAGLRWVRRVVFRRTPKAAGFGGVDSDKSFGGIKLPSLRSTAKTQPTSSYPTPPTPTKYRADFDDVSFGDVSESEYSSHAGPRLSYQPPTATAIAYPNPDADDGSEPSTASTDLTFAPPRAAPRPPAPRAPGPRPVTFPSFEAAQLATP
ncbi:pheromone receptor [Mycena olivaceomarginata]|nr:pheromone receptor [Mycena olivaceomarginata]